MQGQELRKIVGRNVRMRRAELNLTQQQLADRVGITGPFLSEIESARKSLSLDVLAALAEGLATTPSALMAVEVHFSAHAT